MKLKLCKCGCGKQVVGHPNKLFVKGHKDKYHNRVNPRGYGLIARYQRGNVDDEDDERFDPLENDHPFSQEAVQGSF
jgi:hypothetical protein